LNERQTPASIPAREATPVLREHGAVWTLGEIIALIRSWQAPALPSPEPIELATAMSEEPHSESRALSLIAISPLLS